MDNLRDRAQDLLAQLTQRRAVQNHTHDYLQSIAAASTLLHDADRLNGIIVASRDPDMDVARLQRTQALTAGEPLPARVDRLWAQMQAQDQQRQQEQARTWGRER